ncbi:MAG: hypothetical protein ACT4PX_00060 [Actinomycetota bacterium]
MSTRLVRTLLAASTVVLCLVALPAAEGQIDTTTTTTVATTTTTLAPTTTTFATTTTTAVATTTTTTALEETTTTSAPVTATTDGTVVDGTTTTSPDTPLTTATVIDRTTTTTTPGTPTTPPPHRDAAVQQRRDRVARAFGGVEEPADTPDLGRFLDDGGRRPRPRARERTTGGLFLGGLLTAVGAGVVLGARDRAANGRPPDDPLVQDRKGESGDPSRRQAERSARPTA